MSEEEVEIGDLEELEDKPVFEKNEICRYCNNYVRAINNGHGYCRQEKNYVNETGKCEHFDNIDKMQQLKKEIMEEMYADLTYIVKHGELKDMMYNELIKMANDMFEFMKTRAEERK